MNNIPHPQAKGTRRSDYIRVFRWVRDPGNPLEWDGRQVVAICNDLRRAIITVPSGGRYGAMDDLAMMICLDWAQTSRRLHFKMSVRDLAMNLGVSVPTAHKCLTRLHKTRRWLILPPIPNVQPVKGDPTGEAYTYLLNIRVSPHSPALYKNLTLSRPILPGMPSAPPQGKGTGKPAGTRTGTTGNMTVGEVSESYTEAGTPPNRTGGYSERTFTQVPTHAPGAWGRAVMLLRTEYGHSVGISAVRVSVALSGEVKSVTDIAKGARVARSTALAILQDKLEPRGIAVRVGRKWARGIPPEEYAPRYSRRMQARQDLINRQRDNFRDAQDAKDEGVCTLFNIGEDGEYIYDVDYSAQVYGVDEQGELFKVGVGGERDYRTEVNQ